MISEREAEEALEFHTKVHITRLITALTILDRDETIEKTSQAQIEIPKLYDALIEMHHAINQHGSLIGKLTREEILQFALDWVRIVRKYPAAYGPAMRYLY